MIAAIPNSTYVENEIPITGPDVYSAVSSVDVTMPDMNVTNGSTLGFTTTHPTLIDEAILIYNDEYPNGLETFALDAVEGTGTWYVTIPLDVVLTFSITKATWIGAYPVITIQGTNSVDRLMPFAETLTFVSATDIEFVGTNNRAGLLKVGDTIAISDGTTPTAVVLTAVVESGSAPVTYTCTYAAAIVATVNATIPQRSVTAGQVVSRSGDTAKVTTSIEYNPSPNDLVPTWTFLQRKIVSPEGVEITEPLTLDYSQGIA